MVDTALMHSLGAFPSHLPCSSQIKESMFYEETNSLVKIIQLLVTLIPFLQVEI